MLSWLAVAPAAAPLLTVATVAPSTVPVKFPASIVAVESSSTFPNPISDLSPLVATAAKFVTSEEVASIEFFVANDPNPETSPAAVFEFSVLLSVKLVFPKVIVPENPASPFAFT